jgi:pimeloyl-ACP methyl ester carboxylesterase
MTRSFINTNQVQLCVESFGDPDDPSLLLMAGATNPMEWWDERLCQQIAAQGRHVIRYDTRDTGQSTTYPAGRPGYTGTDLVNDVVGLLKALDIQIAHLVGISMGAGIAQHVAVHHPAVVASLTLVSATPDGPSPAGRAELPPPSDRLQQAMMNPPPTPNWGDRSEVIEYILFGHRLFAGTIALDEDRLRVLAGEIYDRSNDIAASMTNHWLLQGGHPVRPRLVEVDAPTLVVHGTEDPFFPIPHGQALADEIPGARLLPVNGMGHQVPPAEVWERLIPIVVDHTADI